MPPAFNLSQDQTLQFDLDSLLFRATHKNGIEVNFTSILMSVCGSLRIQFRRTWQSPSNAHAYRLYVFNDLALFALPAAISEAFYYAMVAYDLATFVVFPPAHHHLLHTGAALLLEQPATPCEADHCNTVF